jgi:hypothetical protein
MKALAGSPATGGIQPQTEPACYGHLFVGPGVKWLRLVAAEAFDTAV